LVADQQLIIIDLTSRRFLFDLLLVFFAVKAFAVKALKQNAETLAGFEFEAERCVIKIRKGLCQLI